MKLNFQSFKKMWIICFLSLDLGLSQKQLLRGLWVVFGEPGKIAKTRIIEIKAKLVK